MEVRDGRLRVVSEGQQAKFVRRVQQVCFHGPSALANGQQVLFVTERAVFELTPQGLVVVELAPGVDSRRDLLARMEFEPLSGTPRPMPAECFIPC